MTNFVGPLIEVFVGFVGKNHVVELRGLGVG